MQISKITLFNPNYQSQNNRMQKQNFTANLRIPRSKSELMQEIFEKEKQSNHRFFKFNERNFSFLSEHTVEDLLTNIRKNVRNNQFYSMIVSNTDLNDNNLAFVDKLMRYKYFNRNSSLERNLEGLISGTNTDEIGKARNMMLNSLITNAKYVNDQRIFNNIGEILYYTDKESKAIARSRVMDRYADIRQNHHCKIPIIDDLVLYTNSLPASDVTISIMNKKHLYTNSYIRENLGDILECANNQAQAKVLNILFNNLHIMKEAGITNKTAIRNCMSIAEQEANLYEGDIYMAKIADVLKSMIEHIKDGKISI